MIDPRSVLAPVCALALAPLLSGLITRTKALIAGRQGAPLLQPYYDLFRLLGKGSVYSTTTTWIFQLGPTVGLATALLALLLLPFAGAPGPLEFTGDLILFAYLLGLGRFLYVLAAMDTGSSFGGMGASREALIGALAEPALFLVIGALARYTGYGSLGAIYAHLSYEDWLGAFPALAMLVGALGVVYLAENARIPVDDPTTHLELTMVHEVMVLDHSGVDLAIIHYTADLKLWLLGSLLVGLVLPVASLPLWLAVVVYLGGMGLLAVVVGVVESVTARVPLLKLPKFIGSASLLAGLAFLLVMGR